MTRKKFAIIPFVLVFVLGYCLFFNKKTVSEPDKIYFVTSAQYPPFEYMDGTELKGFDIDLAKLIAKQLGKEAVFENTSFSAVLPTVASLPNRVGIATLTITPERQKNFDFTDPYYFEGMAAVYKQSNPVHSLDQLKGKKMAAQLGSVMELWLHDHFPNESITALDNNNQAIEALLAGQIDAVLIDNVQARVFSKKHPALAYHTLAKAEQGYGLALPKNSTLTHSINQALHQLQAQGKIGALETFWLKGDAWN